MSDADDEGPPHAFADSRRLTGPSRWFEGSAVILTPLSSAANDPSAHAAWSQRLRAMCATLGWPDPRPVAHRHASGALLAFVAPERALFTATEVNEWAWEQAAADRAFREGFVEAHAMPDPAAAFAQRAAAERSRPLERLKAAAHDRGVPVVVDDDALTVGTGSGGVTWPRAALPLPLDVPWARLHAVPSALVTGSNGKTTTVRALAAMARAAGHTVGLCSTEGVVIDGESMQCGDYSGPAGARAVLRHRRVSFAVLETARGGIARRGLAVAQADVAIVTNISADHFGEYGIDGVADLAELKLAVAHAVRERGLLVLNADDDVLMATADRLPHAATARRALFAADTDHPALTALREGGGATCGARGGRLLLALDGACHDLGAVADLPLTFNGSAPYNTMNLAAATLAAVAGLALPVDAVRATLSLFGLHPDDNPGRLERHTVRGATVLIDYAHNPDGLSRLLAVARALHPSRLLLMLGQAGNRSDEAIAELARTAAEERPDAIVIKELSEMLRGRPSGQVPALLHAALLEAGLARTQVRFGGDEVASATALLDAARPGDVVVLPLHSAAGRAGVARSIALLASDMGADASTANREFVHSRLIDASPEQVFAAFADPARLARWWGPDGFTSTFEVFELRPGGAWRFVLHAPDGTDHPNRNLITAVEAPSRVVVEHIGPPHHFELTITFTAQGAGTRVGWRQRFDTAAEKQRIAHIVVAANEQNLDRLAAEVLRGR